MKLQTITLQIVGVSLLCGTTLSAQNQKPADSSIGTLRTETLFVQVPISVFDKRGHPVHGLTRDNFVVKEDGKVQKVASFEHIEHVANPAIQLKVPDGVYTNRVEQNQPARLTIIAIDAVSTRITERLEARKQILNFISRNVSVDQPVALVMMGQNNVKVLHDFTTDPHVLIAAINHIVAGYSAGASTQSDSAIIQLQPSPFATGSNKIFEQMQMAEADVIQTSFQGFIVGQQRNTMRNTVDSFNELAHAFIGIPGRKSLIWITNGESINTGDVDIANSLDQRNTVASSLSLPTLSPHEADNHIKDSLMTLSDAGVRTNDLLQRTWRLLNDSNIAVYPLDISDMSNPAFTEPGMRVRSALSRPVNEITRLEQFADATGGSLCLRDSNLDDCMKRANEDSQDYYLAGYYASPSTKKETWRSITVSSTRTDVKVRARSGYYIRPPNPANAKTAYSEILTAIGSPLEYTSLPLEVKLDGQEASEKDRSKRKVKFVIFIPPTADFISDSNNAMDLAFAVVAKQADGRPVAEFEREAAGELKPAAVADLSIHGFVISGSVDLVPGTYELKCVARDNHNGHLGSLSVPVKVDTTGLDAKNK